MGDMELVTVNTRFQIVIPPEIRNRAHVDVGDLLEAKIEDGKITLTPQSPLDKHLAEGWADIAAGRTHGPYSTAREAIEAVEQRIAERAKNVVKRP